MEKSEVGREIKKGSTRSQAVVLEVAEKTNVNAWEKAVG